MVLNGKTLSWGACAVWAVFWLMGTVGGIQAQAESRPLAGFVLAALPALALWFWPRVRQAITGLWYVVALVAAAVLLMMAWVGVAAWFFWLLTVGAAWFVIKMFNGPTGAYSGRWMQSGEVSKFAVAESEEASTILMARSPAVERSAKEKNHGLIALKPFTVAKIQRELGHLTVVAPTRSGKGLLLTSHLLSRWGSMLVLDIKGENWKRTSSYRAQLGPVHVLNPEGKGSRFDPFAELLELGSDAETALLQAANVILRPQDEKQKIFPLKAVPILRAGMRVAYSLGEPILPWVYAASRGGLEAYVRFVHERAEELGDTRSIDDLTSFLGVPLHKMKDEQWVDARSVPVQAWANITTSLDRMCTDGVLAMTSGRDFRAADLKQRPTSVYLLWREDMGEGVRDVFSLVALALTKGMSRYADDHEGEAMQEVLFIVDEAGVFEVPDLPRLMATLAGRGVWVSPYFQGLQQMRDVYGEGADQTIIGNSSAVVWYPTPETSAAEYVEKMAGKVSVEVTSVTEGNSTTFSAQGGWSTNQGTTRSMTDRPLITASEFSQLGDSAVLVQVRNHHWLRAQPVRWFEIPHLKQRQGEKGVNGGPISFNPDEYRRRINPPAQRSYVAQGPTESGFYSPDEN